MRDRRGLEVLSRAECLLRLGRGGIGRVAVTVGALPAIFPVNYATLEDDVVFRSAPGTKLTAATRNSIVAFEVDGFDRMDHTGWSVMVVGPADPMTDPAEVSRASALPLASWARGDDDVFVRIEARLVSGRTVTQVVDRDSKEAGGFPLQACPSCGSDASASTSDPPAWRRVNT
jgi:hypothetical protein